ncbi:MAG: hypothetical protein C7B46_19205, partial [Sulfobacillus benefaciens]
MKYLRRNPSKIVPVWAILFLAVVLSSAIGTLVQSFALDAQESLLWSKPFVIVFSTEGRMSPTLVRHIRALQGIRFLYPLATSQVATPSLSGSSNRVILALPTRTIPRVARFAGWALIRGRFPTHPGVVVSAMISDALDARVGMPIGSAVNKGPLPGQEP